MALERNWSLRIKRDNAYSKLKRAKSALATAEAVLGATEDDIKTNKQLLDDVKEYGIIPKEGEKRATPKLELKENMAKLKEEKGQREQEVRDAEREMDVAEQLVEKVNAEIEEEEGKMLDDEEKRLSKFSSSSEEKRSSKSSSNEEKRSSKLGEEKEEEKRFSKASTLVD
jgi:hypothetical protein